MNKYEKQAEKFLKKTKTELKTRFLKNDFYFNDDKEKRDIYEITLKKGERSYTFKFGQSINCSVKWTIYTPKGKINTNEDKVAKKYSMGVKKRNENYSEPTPYDILSCLTKYDPEEFKDFCDNYGYNEDSIKAKKIYDNVVEEYNNLKMLYSDKELKMMQEIQ